MYRYAEYDFDGLQNDPSLDPGDPEVLYALAQCYRLGKGVEKDEAAALAIFREAAAAGSQAAQEELNKAASPEKGAEAGARDYAHMELGELNRLAVEENDPRANLVLFLNSIKWKDPQAAEAYLQQCLETVMDGRQDDELKRDVFENAGRFYQTSDTAKSRHYFELARELGSVDACRVLLRYYKDGIGGACDQELADACMQQLEEKGTPEDLYQCVLTHIREGRRSRAYILLAKLTEQTEPMLKARALIALHELDENETPYRNILPELWLGAEDETVLRELTAAYEKEPDLPVTGEQAVRLAKQYLKMGNRARYADWLHKAQDLGAKEAAPLLRELAEEEARRKAQEEEARRKAEEAARRKAEEEARQKAEKEERRRQAEAERRRKAEEEARRKAEEEARRKAEEEARRKAEEEARQKAEEEARRQAEEAARRKVEEAARRKAEEEARRKAEEEARRKAAEEAARRKAEEAELQRRAAAKDPQALLELGNRTHPAKQTAGNPTKEQREAVKRARGYWLQGAEVGSGACCLNLAWSASLWDQNYEYAINMAKNAARLDASLSGQAQQMIQAAETARSKAEAEQRMQEAQAQQYTEDTRRKWKVQVVLAALAIAEALLIALGRGTVWSLAMGRCFEKAAILVITICTMRALFRYARISRLDLPESTRNCIKTAMREPIQRQLALTVLCGLARVISEKTLVAVFVPYFYGAMLAVALIVAWMLMPASQSGWVAAVLNCARGGAYQWPGWKERK